MSSPIIKALLGVCFRSGALNRRYYPTIGASKALLGSADDREQKKGDRVIAPCMNTQTIRLYSLDELNLACDTPHRSHLCVPHGRRETPAWEGLHGNPSKWCVPRGRLAAR